MVRPFTNNLIFDVLRKEGNEFFFSFVGEALRQKPQEEVAKAVQELRKEVKARGETIETLKGRINLMEKQQNGKEREIDLLRQSLRILGGSSGKNKALSSTTRNFSRSCSPEKLTDANNAETSQPRGEVRGVTVPVSQK
jgi:TolA-binding protein